MPVAQPVMPKASDALFLPTLFNTWVAMAMAAPVFCMTVPIMHPATTTMPMLFIIDVKPDVIACQALAVSKSEHSAIAAAASKMAMAGWTLNLMMASDMPSTDMMIIAARYNMDLYISR